MPNPNNPLPPFQPPQPGDVSVSLADPNEKAIKGFQYNLGPVPPPPNVLNVLKASIHFEYAASKTLYEESGLCCSPVMGPIGTPMSVTRITAPWGRLAVRWRAARNNGNPVIPSTDLGDANVVFEKGWRIYQGPGFYPDGTDAQIVEGLYLFWLRLPYLESDSLLTAAYPGTGELIAVNEFGPEDFSKKIIGPNLPPQAAGNLSGINF